MAVVNIDRDHIRAMLVETMADVLKNNLPEGAYTNNVEFDGVVGIRLDGTTEFFVTLHDSINKTERMNQDSSMPVTDGEPVDITLPTSERMTSEELSGTQQILSVPTVGNLPLGSKFIMPNKDVQRLLCLLKKHEADDELQSSTPLHAQDQIPWQCGQVDVPLIPDHSGTDGAQQGDLQTPPKTGDVTSLEQLETEKIMAILPLSENEEFVHECEVALSGDMSQEVAPPHGSKHKPSKLYKVPKEHLESPPCECCLILQRYREKDKNVRRRRKILETTGKLPPRCPPSKVYKLPKNHVNRCSCCEVLQQKREYWKELSQRRRDRSQTLK